MEIIDKILEKHTKILDTEETIIETYTINEDIEIGIHQTRDNIYMYAYSYDNDRNVSIKTNFKKLYNGFKKVAKDKYISKNKGYSYKLILSCPKEVNTQRLEIQEDIQNKLIDVKIESIKKYFIKALNAHKSFEKEDIIRVAEGLGIEVNKRISKTNLIDMIIDKGFYKELYEAFEEFIYIPVWEVADHYKLNTNQIDELHGIRAIEHEPREKEFYSRSDKSYFKANTYHISILLSYKVETLKKVYDLAFKHEGYRLRLETKNKEEVQELINEFKKIFKVRSVDTYERRNEGYNSYFTIEKINNNEYQGNAILLEIQKLKNEIQELKNENFEIRKESNKNLLNCMNINNSRGAGRKSKFTDSQIQDIKALRSHGSTISAIAKKYNCSVGLIHKLINEK